MAAGPAAPAPDVTPLPGAEISGLALGSLTLPLPGVDNHPPLTLILPASVDAVLDFYIETGAADADPYWARPWPAGAALAAALVADPRRVVNASLVLDLGAGLGIAGLAAARAGAARVVVTDRDPLALACAEKSAQASGIPPDVLTTAILDWDDDTAMAAAAADVVLAADVLYEERAAAPVADALARLVKPGGCAIVADPAIRAPSVRAAFAQALAGRLVLESWRAVDGDTGAAAGPTAKGAVLLLTLVAPVGGHSLRVAWP